MSEWDVENRGSRRYMSVQRMEALAGFRGMNRTVEEEGIKRRITEAVGKFGDFISTEVDVKKGMVYIMGTSVPTRVALKVRELGYRAKLLSLDPAQEEDDSLRTNPTFLKASFLSAFVGWSVFGGWASEEFLRPVSPPRRVFFIEAWGLWGYYIAMMNLCTVHLCEAYNNAPTISRLGQIKFVYIRPPFALTMVFGQQYAPTPPHGIWNFIRQMLFIIRKQTFYFVGIHILSYIVNVFLNDIVKVSLQLGLFSQRFIDCTKFYVTYFLCSHFLGFYHSLLGFYYLVWFPGSLFFKGRISFYIRTYFFSFILIYIGLFNLYFFATLTSHRKCSATEDLTLFCPD